MREPARVRFPHAYLTYHTNSHEIQKCRRKIKMRSLLIYNIKAVKIRKYFSTIYYEHTKVKYRFYARFLFHDFL